MPGRFFIFKRFSAHTHFSRFGNKGSEIDFTSLISITKKANRKEHIPTSRSKRANTKPVSRRETHTKGYMNPTKRETLSFILGYSAQAPYRDPAHSALEFHCGDQYLRPSKSPCSPMSPPQPHQRYSYSRRGPT